MIGLKIKNGEVIKKIIIIVSLLCISCFLTYYFNIILKINIIFSHFFYLPLILACIWWKYKGIFVSLFLAGLLIIIPFLAGSYSFLFENLIRAIILILIGVVIAFLSKQISMVDELKRAYNRIALYKDLFLHDMSNILQCIKSSAELYSLEKKKGRNLDDLNQYINIINEFCLRGGVLISNIHTFSELEDLKPTLIAIEVSKLLNKSIEIIKKAIQGKEVIINIEGDGNNLLVLANDLLENVFDNILLNAIKHNERSPIEIKIKISEVFVDGKNYVKMQFIDNGMGIEDKRKEIIFQQNYSREKKNKRNGFGLSLVKKIIDNYNGMIWVEDSTVGNYSKGSNFIVLLQKAN